MDNLAVRRPKSIVFIILIDLSLLVAMPLLAVVSVILTGVSGFSVPIIFGAFYEWYMPGTLLLMASLGWPAALLPGFFTAAAILVGAHLTWRARWMGRTIVLVTVLAVAPWGPAGVLLLKSYAPPGQAVFDWTAVVGRVALSGALCLANIWLLWNRPARQFFESDMLDSRKSFEYHPLVELTVGAVFLTAVSAIVGVLMLLVLYQVVPTRDWTTWEYVVPDGYQGYLAIRYDCPSGSELRAVNGVYRVDFGANGVFCTSSPFSPSVGTVRAHTRGGRAIPYVAIPAGKTGYGVCCHSTMGIGGGTYENPGPTIHLQLMWVGDLAEADAKWPSLPDNLDQFLVKRLGLRTPN